MERDNEGAMAGRIQDLTIVCVTNGKGKADFLAKMRHHADYLDACFLVGTDGEHGYRMAMEAEADIVAPVKGNGYLESILDEVMKKVQTEYVLRLDDDERLSPALVEWLRGEWYKEYEIVTFPRANLWGDEYHFLSEYPWWMDEQTRLGKTSLMLGRNEIHQGNPNGAGVTVPYVIEHHKFLIKDYAERLKIALLYESVRKGAGLGEFLPFNLPEETCRELRTSELGNGYKEGFKA